MHRKVYSEALLRWPCHTPCLRRGSPWTTAGASCSVGCVFWRRGCACRPALPVALSLGDLPGLASTRSSSFPLPGWCVVVAILVLWGTCPAGRSGAGGLQGRAPRRGPWFTIPAAPRLPARCPSAIGHFLRADCWWSCFNFGELKGHWHLPSLFLCVHLPFLSAAGCVPPCLCALCAALRVRS